MFFELDLVITLIHFSVQSVAYFLGLVGKDLQCLDGWFV